MITIGIDPHKQSHTAVAVTPLGELLDELTVRADVTGHERLRSWAHGLCEGEELRFALRFRAYGKRRCVRLGTADGGWNRHKAEEELANVLADVRRGIWRPRAAEDGEAAPEPTFHEFASEWLESRRHEFAARTVEDYTLALTHHLLPFFKTTGSRRSPRMRPTATRPRRSGSARRAESSGRCRIGPSTRP